ncbi:response regulator [Sphingobacterium composti Ten et al. 2007 non Yoo et al. 2007]|uniref:response regulator n=1 Tax=Sphingobacterium composti TaxID=363260 RepID=UPI001358FD2A|nr:response regulator [Sphingobacterium composti Ten et al. 2007 non Yoo et al. 2007]
MNPIRVTLVEDNAIFCFLFKKFLEDYPSRKIVVEVFSDGKKAWDHFVSIQGQPELFPQMIFIDINMPFMNGWELIENLVVNDFNFIKEIPSYIVSSSKSSLDIGKFKEYKFIKDYIIKPIDREGIYAILDKYQEDLL